MYTSLLIFCLWQCDSYPYPPQKLFPSKSLMTSLLPSSMKTSLYWVCLTVWQYLTLPTILSLFGCCDLYFSGFPCTSLITLFWSLVRDPYFLNNSFPLNSVRCFPYSLGAILHILTMSATCVLMIPKSSPLVQTLLRRTTGLRTQNQLQISQASHHHLLKVTSYFLPCQLPVCPSPLLPVSVNGSTIYHLVSKNLVKFEALLDFSHSPFK